MSRCGRAVLGRRAEFKHLEYYYFHNCLYEGVWRDNRRRWTEQIPTHEVMNTYGPTTNASSWATPR
jgi:uncharacterized protein with von Willebrand factor type A (vWA) domain